jgi:uncharacterized protein
MIAVFDTNTVVSAIFWPKSTARRCLAGLARRQYQIAISAELFEEYETVLARLQPRFPACNAAGSLAWIRFQAVWVESAQLGKQRSRDPDDDPILACALSARAKFVITRDDDLLILGKPFGIEIVTPIAFLAWLRNRRQLR